MGIPYLDASALAKWYLNEPRSEDFEQYITRRRSAHISRLGMVEFRCLLSRRSRSKEISRKIQAEVFSRFLEHIREGYLAVHPLDDAYAWKALELLDRLNHHPLRTLDALHLATALALKASELATADRVMADAAEALGMVAVRFD